MGYVFINPNPKDLFTGDCAIRAICVATGADWLETYIEICAQGAMNGDMPDSNSVIFDYLTYKGFTKHLIDRECETCYKLKDFCGDHPKGTFIIGTGSHMVAVIDGDYYDTADSGDCLPAYYFVKEENTDD